MTPGPKLHTIGADIPGPGVRKAGWDFRNRVRAGRRVGDGHDAERIAAARAKRRRKGVVEPVRVLELNKPR